VSIRRAVVLLLLVVGPVPARGAGALSERAVRAALAATSVVVEPSGCAGVLAESTQVVLTARHCVPGEGRAVRVRFTTGWLRRAWVVARDERADQAALLLEDPVPIEPLPIVRRPQIPGTVLYFTGNPGRPRFQRARLERIGRCPSLPGLPDALFTTIDGVPGDSGAPAVDLAGRIVGLVHGGTRCHILTPAASLLRLVDHLLDGVPLRL
jgi:S1-C subfamily serine protease